MVEDNVAIQIYKQINRMLNEKLNQAKIINHNLEKGLGNENALREVFRDFFPLRFGIAKGKVINSEGSLSKQCDIIIYDQINCPKLFIDENQNQIIPIEGVYYVMEVKTTLNSEKMKESFDNLFSVYNLKNCRRNKSENDLVEVCPPGFGIFAFNDNRSLESINENFNDISIKYPVKESFHCYSITSPGRADVIERKFLVSDLVVLNKTYIHHMHSGDIKYSDYKDFSLGVFLNSLLMKLNWISSTKVSLNSYLKWYNINNYIKD